MPNSDSSRSSSNQGHLKPIIHSSSRSRDSSQDSERSESSTNTDSMGHQDPESGDRVRHHRVPDHPSRVVTTTIVDTSGGERIYVHAQKKGYEEAEYTTGSAKDEDYSRKRREQKEIKERKKKEAERRRRN